MARLGLGAAGLALLLVMAADPRGASRAASEATIAVKPLSGDALPAEMRSVATDLTDALRTRLAGIDGARVRAWSANAPPPALVFDGSVTTAGDRLELHVRLVDTATGGTVWSESASGKAYEVLSGADALLANAANAAARRLSPGASLPHAPPCPRRGSAASAFAASSTGWPGTRRPSPRPATPTHRRSPSSPTTPPRTPASPSRTAAWPWPDAKRGPRPRPGGRRPAPGDRTP